MLPVACSLVARDLRTTQRERPDPNRVQRLRMARPLSSLARSNVSQVARLAFPLGVVRVHAPKIVDAGQLETGRRPIERTSAHR